MSASTTAMQRWRTIPENQKREREALRARGGIAPDKRRQYQNKFNRTPKGKKYTFGANIKRLYGLTIDQWHEMLKEQVGRCASCDAAFTGYNEPHVDHNHETGVVRGLLCKACNQSIGLLKDRAENADALAAYLRRADQ